MRPIRVGAVGLVVGAVILVGVGIGANAPSSAPIAGVVPRSAPSSIAVIGDFGSDTLDERAVAGLVKRIAPATVVTTGDNLYSARTYGEAVGAYYCRWIAGAPATASCPRAAMARVNAFFPATGNHDYSDGGIGNYLSYFASLRGRTSYAVTPGGVEFLVVDSQAALDSPTSMARQFAWTRDRARSSTAAWQVVVLHHPPFSSGSVHGSTPAFQWPFASWGVDLVLSGHDHDYERISRGPVTYIVDGSGGAELYPLGDPLPGSLVRDDTEHGVLLLTPLARGLQGAFWSVTGRLVDSFLLRR